MTTGLLSNKYADLCAKGELSKDHEQQVVIAELEKLQLSLQQPQGRLPFMRRRSNKHKGIYIHGDAGRGKTLLMDLFYENIKGIPKYRQHFHEFMQDLHQGVKEIGTDSKEQPITLYAAKLGKRYKLLCFDEFHVTDIADAMILGRLWQELWRQDVAMVATSNIHPDKLYAGGLQRELFTPFIDLLKARIKVIELNGATDYRQQFLAQAQKYFYPINADTNNSLQHIFNTLGNHEQPVPYHLEVNGRHIVLSRTAAGVAWLSFAEICAQPLAASDYLAIANNFHTVIMSAIPQLGEGNQNEAKRFITFIDVLYDQGINFIANAAVSVDQLYTQGKYVDLFRRTTSRLIEMTGG